MKQQKSHSTIKSHDPTSSNNTSITVHHVQCVQSTLVKHKPFHLDLIEKRVIVYNICRSCIPDCGGDGGMSSKFSATSRGSTKL